MVVLTKILTDKPCHLFSLGYFSEIFGAAKSSISEDILIIKETLQQYGLGTLETQAGALGGVEFIPIQSEENTAKLLHELAVRLSTPERIIPGGYLYMSDILCVPHLMTAVGEAFRTRFSKLRPDYVMTVETKGIPLAFMTARAFNLPLVIARNDSRVTEGSAVSINYISGSTKRIQTMSLAKRALPAGAKVLVIDDFMKAGGTAKGLHDLAEEVGANVIGTGFLVATAEPQQKLIDNYLSLLILNQVNEHTKKVDIVPGQFLQ